MRVLICSNVFPPQIIGGAEIVAFAHAKELQKLGCEVEVFAGIGVAEQTYHLQKEVVDGLTVHRLSMPFAKYDVSRIHFADNHVDWAFARVVDEFAPDLVHAHNLSGLSAGILFFASARQIPTAVTLHDYWGFCFKNTWLKRATENCFDTTGCSTCLALVDPDHRRIPEVIRRQYLRTALATADAFISPSRFLADAYIAQGFDGAKFEVLSNGVELSRFSIATRRTDEKLRITYVGAMAPHKGVNVLLDAAAKAQSKGVQLTLTLAGGGPQLPELKARSEALGLSSSARFLGPVAHKDMPQLYANSDVLVAPSIWRENEPVSINEAMASGVPVIGSRIGGIAEQVSDGINGWLFRANDADDLERCLADAINNRHKLAVFAVAARARMALRTHQTAARRLLNVFQSLRQAERRPASVPATVVCYGWRFSDDAVAIVEALTPSLLRDELRLLMHEWAGEKMPSEPRVIWVVDPDYMPDTAFERASAAIIAPRGWRGTRVANDVFEYDSIEEARVAIEVACGVLQVDSAQPMRAPA